MYLLFCTGADNDGIDIAYAKEFCRSHSDQINLTGVTRVTTGVIYSPDYESGSYKKLRDRAVCIINFSAANMSGQHGSLIVFRMVRAGNSGPRLGNKVIKTSIVKGECPEEKVIMGPDGINLTLELGKHPQPIFHIKFTGQLSYMFSTRNAHCYG